MIAEGEYFVRAILGKRLDANGNAEYLIDWEGYHPSEAEWIPVRDVLCAEMVAAWEGEQAALDAAAGDQLHDELEASLGPLPSTGHGMLSRVLREAAQAREEAEAPAMESTDGGSGEGEAPVRETIPSSEEEIAANELEAIYAGFSSHQRTDNSGPHLAPEALESLLDFDKALKEDFTAYVHPRRIGDTKWLEQEWDDHFA